MGTPVNIIVGSHVWVEDAEIAWIDGVVKEINGGEATVALSNDKTAKAILSRMHPKDREAAPSGMDDMTKLSYLNEPSVLHNLASRFATNEIYTYTGNILIAVNPFQRLTELYNLETMKKYKGAVLGELSPHLFAVADSCYRAIINDDGSQSILVSGESGAGKTETTKMLMRYLAFMGGKSGGIEARTIEQQVLESNPVLEAFGNAKTVKNNNSSRFGKFVEIQFDNRGKISGAAIRTYLLERSRVCQVSSPERNYHCFYMLCAAPPEEAKKFKISDPKAFHYLNQSNCYEVANVNDANEYLETRHAMDVVGIIQEDQEAIFRVVAAILHLGNVNFTKAKGSDSATLKDEESAHHLKTAVELLMCDEKLLEDSLCKRVIVTPDGKITKPLEPEAAAITRDALAKTIYSRLFDWIVDKINNSIGQDPSAKYIIGVLDIYGFESFRINSFEQLCINLTNEKLQQHFNQHVFKMEQEEYTKEKINWSYVEFVDNQDVLDLIEKKPGGIIALLDEACMFPKSTHETFAEKMYQTYKNHKRFTRPKLARTTFTVNHYAGDVTYTADQFLDKNKDYVIAEHQALLNASECHFVSNLFPPSPEETSKQSKFSSIGSRFKQQLQSLMDTLNTTEPHYIRCVKPNTVLKPGIFENFNVLGQLRCGGVLEAIRISCAGYPTRRTFNEFIARFGRMLSPELINGTDEVKCVEAICDRMGLKGYQIGKTKVFLRAGQMAALDARRMEVFSSAAKVIQRQWHTYLARKTYITQRRTSVQIQKFWRAFLGRKKYKSMKSEDASIRVQKYARAFNARRSYRKLCFSARTIQTGIRAINARNQLRDRRRIKAAIVIQTQWRVHKQRSSYKNKKKATLVLQSLWRGCLGRKQLRKLKMAAKEAGALKEAKEKLEKKVEELTQKLDAEKNMRDDVEETKGQEIAELQAKLQDMQETLEQAQEEIITLKEAVRVEIAQENSGDKEVPEVDANMVELTHRNEKLEAKDTAIFGLEAARVEIVQENSVNKEVPEADANMVELTSGNEKLEEELSNFKSKDEESEERYTLNEMEAARVKIVQENSVNKEVPEAETNMVELTRRNEKLEKELSNFKSKAEEFEEKYTKLLNQVEDTRFASVQEDSVNRVVSDADANMVELIRLNEKLEEELSNFKSKAEELEERYTKVLNQVDELLRGKEESSLKISQIQYIIESLKRKINRSNSENELLHNQPAIIDHQQSVTSESIEPLVKEELLSDQPDEPSSEYLLNNQPTQQSIIPETIGPPSRNELRRNQSAQPSVNSELIEPPIMKIKENGHIFGDEAKLRKKDSTVSPLLPSFRNIKSPRNQQQDNYEALIKCLAEYKSFDNNRPAAAVIVYKSLFHWHLFEAERTNIFDQITQTIKSSVKDQENVGVLAYWLSTASTLLFLLQKNLRPHNASGTGSYCNRAKASTLFSRMTRSNLSSSSILDLSSGYSERLGSKSGPQSRIEAKYPALLFKRQLTAFVEKIYGTIRDNLKKEITPFLTKCLQAPSITREKTPTSIISNIMARQESSIHWKSLVKSLDCTLNALSKNHVPPLIIRITFSQVFSFINVQLFNSIILRRECCSFSSAEFINGGLLELEQWCSKTTDPGAGTSWEQLQPVRQAIRFLVLQQKSETSFTEIKNEVCPALSLPQINRLATMFSDDIDGTEGLSQEVKAEIEDMMNKNSTTTVLLEDDMSIPCGLSEIARWGLVITTDNVEPPPLLRQNSEFNFLLPQKRRHET